MSKFLIELDGEIDAFKTWQERWRKSWGRDIIGFIDPHKKSENILRKMWVVK